MKEANTVMWILTFNRTIIELKHQILSQFDGSANDTFNRTIIELKRRTRIIRKNIRPIF